MAQLKATAVIRARDETAAAFASVQRRLKGMQSATATASRNMRAGIQGLRNMGGSMTLLSAPVTALGGATTRVMADFESSMNTIQARLQTTREAIQPLRDLAKELGASTQFSASQVGKAMDNLIASGMSIEQTLNAAPQVLQLAAAGELTIQRAAEIATGIKNQFGLAVSDLERVNDVLSYAANLGATTVTEMGTGFSKAGATFAAVGQGVEDLSAALVVLQNSDIKAEVAGTALNTMVARLMKPTAQAKAAIEGLGLSMTDFVNNGELDFKAFIDGAAAAGAQAEDLIAIFGAEHFQKALILARASTEGTYQKILDDIETKSQGATKRATEIMIQGLPGALKSLASSFEGFMIHIGENGLSARVIAIADQLKAALGAFQQLPPEIVDQIVGIGMALAAGGPLIIGLSLLMSAIMTLLSPVSLISVAIAGLAVAFVAFYDQIKDMWAFIRGKTIQNDAKEELGGGRAIHTQAMENLKEEGKVNRLGFVNQKELADEIARIIAAKVDEIKEREGLGNRRDINDGRATIQENLIEALRDVGLGALADSVAEAQTAMANFKQELEHNKQLKLDGQSGSLHMANAERAMRNAVPVAKAPDAIAAVPVVITGSDGSQTVPSPGSNPVALSGAAGSSGEVVMTQQVNPVQVGGGALESIASILAPVNVHILSQPPVSLAHPIPVEFVGQAQTHVTITANGASVDGVSSEGGGAMAAPTVGVTGGDFDLQ